ncbi:MAG: endonuclease Q family protein [Patescibacteria group bacterium]|nr:endonuclease Q family protein [Patescibacteria group bacterium]
MKFVADFHIHSKYSRATSPDLNLENLDKAAKTKGIDVLATGDFTHPLWLREIKEKLAPVEPGLFRLKQGGVGARFILSSEISCIYSKNNKTRKIHVLILAPDIATVEKINAHLGWIGNLKSDGRPILGLDAKELAKIALNANPDCLVVPCHIWTPWFSLFGSKSGFDSIEECFEEFSPYIYAVETGLSSDPAMNWRLSALDKLSIISCSDAHSAAKLGREACVFDAEMNYPAIMQALKQKDQTKFLSTIEFFPEEGKYHFDGHRDCKISFSPKETKKHNGICPVCAKPLTLGVLYRVEELADRPEGFVPANAIPFKNLIPLAEIIGEAMNVGPASKAVEKEYKLLIGKFGSEFNILLDVPETELQSAALPEIAEAISLMRQGKVNIEPGFDGVFGKISIFQESQRAQAAKQNSLF